MSQAASGPGKLRPRWFHLAELYSDNQLIVSSVGRYCINVLMSVFLQEGDHRCNWALGPITVQKDSRPEMRMHPPSEAIWCGGETSQKRDFYEYF